MSVPALEVNELDTFARVVIGNEHVPSDYAPVVNPARNQEIVGHYALGTADHVERAVQTAHEAASAWGALGADGRAVLMSAAVPKLRSDVDGRARLLTREQGKVLWESLTDVGGPPAILEYFLGLAPEFGAPVATEDERGRIVTMRRPMGVTAVIVPWNYPVYLAFQHIVPALLAGNPVIVKPSEYAPLALTATVEILAQALPPGVLNVVPGSGAEVGTALTRHRLVRKVLFTGSTATGRRILHAGADTVKSVTLELGGNDPAIVLEDAKFTDDRISEMVRAVYTCAGQVCFNVKRIYVHESRIKEFTDSFAAAVDDIVVGNGLDERSTIGPLNNGPQFERVQGLLNEATADGGTVRTLGRKLSEESWLEGYFLLPSIVTGLPDAHNLVTCEQFGPVVPIVPFRTEEEALKLANDSEFGLAASVWSDDVDHAMSVAAQIEAGSVFINVHRMGASDMTMPFGGIKQSGLGRTHGMIALEECSDVQVIAHRANTDRFPGPARSAAKS